MAATGTPTPNIGLRRPQGTDPASVNDINYNSNLIDTKLGPVGNTSVQAQIDGLNSKIAWRRLYGNATYTDHTGVPLQLSESLQNVKLLFVTAYTQTIASANRIVFIIPVNSNIGASYYYAAWGSSTQTIRVEGSGTSFTVLSSSLPNGLFINEIVALG